MFTDDDVYAAYLPDDALETHGAVDSGEDLDSDVGDDVRDNGVDDDGDGSRVFFCSRRRLSARMVSLNAAVTAIAR